MDLLEKYNEINQFGTHLSLQFIEAKDGICNYSLTVKEEHLATKNVIHGGVLAAFMDSILGVACLSLSGKEKKLVATLELKTTFLEPAFLGDKLIGTGKVIKKGNRIYFSQGEIVNQKGELVCTGNGTFNAYPAQKVGIEL